MRTILRVCVVCKEGVAPYAADIIKQLTEVLARVRSPSAKRSPPRPDHALPLLQTCKNPTNPMFAHNMFECVAALMRFICAATPDAVAAFEGMLSTSSRASMHYRTCFNPFLLKLSYAQWPHSRRFSPRTYQTSCRTSSSSSRSCLTCALRRAQVRGLRRSIPEPSHILPRPPLLCHPGESNLTDAFKALLPPLFTAPLWLRKGNVPALTQLACAYAHKGSVFISQSGQLLPLLGVFQRLLGQRPHEDFAFDIICALGVCGRGNDAPADCPRAAPLPTLNLPSQPRAPRGRSSSRTWASSASSSSRACRRARRSARPAALSSLRASSLASTGRTCSNPRSTPSRPAYLRPS